MVLFARSVGASWTLLPLSAVDSDAVLGGSQFVSLQVDGVVLAGLQGQQLDSV